MPQIIQTNTGHYNIDALLKVEDMTVLDFGLENVVKAVDEDLAAHNARVTEMVSVLCEPTTERGKVYGTAIGGRMERAGEYTRGPTQRVQAGGKVHWPMYKHQFATGWTREWFEVKTPADLALALRQSEFAHLGEIQDEIQLAFYSPTNRTVRDQFNEKDAEYELAVRALLNGDGDPVPSGPNGETFDGATHSHYLGLAAGYTATQLNSALRGLIDTVVEHGHGKGLMLYINRADETEVSALADFLPLKPEYVISGTANDSVRGTLNMTVLDNRQIGWFHGAEVWTKPWAFSRYPIVAATGDERKPLAFRRSKLASRSGLRLAGELDTHPMYARYMEDYFGVGASQRTAAAVLNIGNATYQVPAGLRWLL
jgi:hypothetical protein